MTQVNCLSRTFAQMPPARKFFSRQQTKSPCPTSRSGRDKLGGGSSPRSLSHAGIWRALAASFPTPFSTASGVAGLIAGPSSALRSLNYRVRPLSPLQPAIAVVDSRTRERHVCDFVAASLPLLSRDSHRFWRRVGPKPRVWPLNSQVAFRSQAGGVLFNIACALEGMRALPAPLFLPGPGVFCPAFQRLLSGAFRFRKQPGRPFRSGAQ